MRVFARVARPAWRARFALTARTRNDEISVAKVGKLAGHRDQNITAMLRYCYLSAGVPNCSLNVLAALVTTWTVSSPVSARPSTSVPWTLT